MKCSEVEELLELYLTQELDLKRRSAVENHLLSCTACAHKLADLAQIRDMMSALCDEELPDGLHQRIMQSVAAARAGKGSAVSASVQKVDLHPERDILFPSEKRLGNNFGGRRTFTWPRVAAIAAIAAALIIAGRGLIEHDVLEQHTAAPKILDGQQGEVMNTGLAAMDVLYESVYEAEETEALQQYSLTGSGPSALLQLSEAEEAVYEDSTETQGNEGGLLTSFSLQSYTLTDGSDESVSESVSEAENVDRHEVESGTGSDEILLQMDAGDSKMRAQGVQVEAAHTTETDAMPDVMPISIEEEAPETEMSLAAQPHQETLMVGGSDEAYVDAVASTGGGASDASLPPGSDGSELLIATDPLELQKRSAEWRLSVYADRINLAQAASKALELRCRWTYAASGIRFYGSGQALQRLLLELQLSGEPVWSNPSEALRWADIVLSDDGALYYLMITVLPITD